MLIKIRSHLSYANITATLALFVALGGVSYAAVTLPKNSVGSAQIKKSAVTGSKVRNSSLTGSDIRNKSLSPADFSGSMRGSQGPAGPVGPAGKDGGNGSPDSPQQVLGKLAQVDGPASGLDADALDGLDSSVFAPLAAAVLDGDAAGGDLSASYPDPQIAANAVGAGEIATSAVGTSEIATDAVGRSELGNGSVGLPEMSSGGDTNGSINFGVVPANGCLDSANTLGAQFSFNLGELVIPRPTTDPGAGLYFVPTIVTHENERVLRLCNATGGPIDPPFISIDFTTVGI